MGSRGARRVDLRVPGSPTGIKGHITKLAPCPDGTPITADFVIGSYYRLFEIKIVQDVEKRPAGPSSG